MMTIAEARIIEAILNPEHNSEHRVSELRSLARDALNHFKERAEMKVSDLKAKLELADVRDAQRKEALEDAKLVIAELEDRERELEARIDRGELFPETPEVLERALMIRGQSEFEVRLRNIYRSMEAMSPFQEKDGAFAVCVFIEMLKAGISADQLISRMTRV